MQPIKVKVNATNKESRKSKASLYSEEAFDFFEIFFKKNRESN